MNQKDLSDLKRRLNPDKKNPSILRGCYVSPNGDIISGFSTHMEELSQEDNEKYMALFRRVLSGTQGRNLIPVGFTTEQVDGGEEYRLLWELRETALRAEELVSAFYDRVITWIRGLQEGLSVEETQKAPNWLILLLHDGMDVSCRDGNGEIDRERSDRSFSYILGAVCPVRQNKPGLSWRDADGSFRSREADWVVSAPELGLLFPAFEDGGANVYSAMLYTKNAADPHESFVRSVLGTEPLMPASEQQETLGDVLAESLGDECSMEVLQAAHEKVGSLIAEQKKDKHAEPLVFSGKDMSRIMQECGVSLEKAEAFEEQYEETFGSRAELPAVNVLTPNEYKVTTPSVSIKVDPEHSNLVQTRVIDGQCYVMVLVDGDVQVNGIRVQM